MKQNRIFLIIAGIIITSAIIVSCNKQEQVEINSSSPNTSQSNADVQIENKIKAFKSKLEYIRENPTLKSGETMVIDSALWYIEAASNQTYGDAGTPFSEMVVDSFDIVLPTSAGEIQMNDLQVAYEEMINNLSDGYNAIPDENKHLVMNNVSLKSEGENTVVFGIAAGIGIEGNDGISNIFNQSWFYGQLMGDCVFNFWGTDAAEEIEKKSTLERVCCLQTHTIQVLIHLRFGGILFIIQMIRFLRIICMII